MPVSSCPRLRRGGVEFWDCYKTLFKKKYKGDEEEDRAQLNFYRNKALGMKIDENTDKSKSSKASASLSPSPSHPTSAPHSTSAKPSKTTKEFRIEYCMRHPNLCQTSTTSFKPSRTGAGIFHHRAHLLRL